MIILFTDFGANDIYVGQVHAVLAQQAPGVPVIDLLHAAPDFDICSSAYLLDVLQRRFPAGSVFLAVVDPGVGGGRAPLMVRADGRWFIAPDNGLLTGVIRYATEVTANKVLWAPVDVSTSFHGRDLFAPVAAMLATGITPEHETIAPVQLEWKQNLDQVIYVDHYGNAITGRFGDAISKQDRITIKNREISYARYFCEKEAGELFWYVNSIGLVEISANQARADKILSIHVGDTLNITSA